MVEVGRMMVAGMTMDVAADDGIEAGPAASVGHGTSKSGDNVGRDGGVVATVEVASNVEAGVAPSNVDTNMG